MNDIDDKIIDHEKEVETRKSAEEMDEQRQKTLAYEYLCHLEEAKKWLEACLRETLPQTIELEENLRNGVYLAKLAHFMAPDSLPFNKIYDPEQKRYTAVGLQFRHTDNINYFLKSLKTVQLPLTFQPETTDIYDKKNMPRVIYCIHALSTHLFKLGRAPQIQDLYGKVNFTDDEINAVSKELKKYGIQMPSFQKIGGLLANSMEIDAVTLHAAVIAINQAITEKDNVKMLMALQNKVVQINNINPLYIKEYGDTLTEAKYSKQQAALNRSLNDSYVPDIYDELLTQAEIQGHINYVNVECAVKNISRSIHHNNNEFVNALRASALCLKNIKHENAELYKEQLMQLLESSEWNNMYSESNHHLKQLLQKEIDKSNETALKSRKREEGVKLLNSTLQNGLKNEFSEALKSPKLGLIEQIDDFAIPLYYEEMKIDRTESQNDLSYSDIVVSIRVLSVIAAISKAVDTGNPDLVYQSLENPDCHVSGLDHENKVKYYRALSAVRCEKQAIAEECPLLTYIDIQECIDAVNQQRQNDDDVIQVLRQLNAAVVENDRDGIIIALKDTALKLQKFTSPEDASLYLKLFKKCLTEKHFDGSELWLEDVETITKIVAAESENVQNACTFLSQVNLGLQQNDMLFTVDCLQTFGFKISDKYKTECFQSLCNLQKMKSKKYNCALVRYITPKGNESYLDLKKYNYTWDCPKNISETYYINMEDIKEIIKSTTAREHEEHKISKRIVRLQACIRGYLLRKKISVRFAYFYDNVDKVIKIQAWWRGILQRKRYAKLLTERRNYSSEKFSSNCLRIKNKYANVLDYYKQHEEKIIKIQALWRGRAERRAFHSLLYMEKPPFPVVRHFSALLNFNAEDYDRDLQLQQLKHEVVQNIRHNQTLSQQLDSMDIKIGLLIQNRITLQDVVAHGKSLETLAKQKNSTRDQKNVLSDSTISHKGLKSLTKEGRKMLEGYQHLFYALQTNPTYLSKILFLLPQSKTNKFLQNVILTLYNFGSNIREEYLLLKLFGSALQEEIRCKFQKPSEVVTGNPLVLKMVVNYARQLHGQRALRQIVGPIIEKILADRTLNIETNPVDIYKCWRNQLEMETGETLNLPYTVTQQQALNYEQVRIRLNKGIQLLQSTVLEFLTKITESRDLIPYGMLYMAKILNDSLTEKFPNAPEKDILKVVGNLIYYHFINAAIVAPDAFDIITLPIDRSLSNDQRRNLASIAKILQFAASKKGFGEEATHLVCLNSFIIECHEKFKKFFRFCCQIEDLEEHFCIHEYTEATLIQKPEIYISLQEICDTHCLMLEYQDQIAPDPMDPLHDLLDDLGPAPTVASLLGISDTMCEANLIRFGKTEVCLVLTNKFQVPEDEDASLNKLFIKTKELLVSVLQFLKGQTLVEALETTCSPVQEKLYDVKCSSLSPTLSIIHKSSSLNDCKLQLRAYLNKLELGGWVSRSDGYQTIITAVSKDLCNKGKYRIIRNKELQTLRITKQRLEEKCKYYQEQVEYYNEYIQRCLENLHTGKGSLRAFKAIQKNNHGKLRSKMTLKYSAAKLQEKGILLEVDGLPQSQFKNVIFEISPTEHTGLFNVRCKFMGVEMEKVDIDIQKLLELQFEGSPIMDMFGKAKVNVNLLLYLLNRKFYGKT
ncbi:ras GTPase-activating-like protein IQGAP1 isoform X1 [Megachile rotundata]|uniref:ras GTPase-activating-like protein IQGAP1 isoform X1 n=1 Tax=Megachile rotundata TaxID=143995 RepID=UPI0006152DE1|nr:PREDICTED: ras GTPase-activating-like protein IQGAP1 isoform X3 [Megachile rotundata]